MLKNLASKSISLGGRPYKLSFRDEDIQALHDAPGLDWSKPNPGGVRPAGKFVSPEELRYFAAHVWAGIRAKSALQLETVERLLAEELDRRPAVLLELDRAVSHALAVWKRDHDRKWKGF